MKRTLLALAILCCAGVAAQAQPQPQPQPGAPQAEPPRVIRPQKVVNEMPPPAAGAQPTRIQVVPTVDGPAPAAAPAGSADVAPEQPRPYGTGAAIAFWLFATLVVLGSIVMITRRNAVTAVMSLVGTFAAVAGLYVLLFAHFLAAIQVLVYAGAIMVLFVFVVMILNKEEEEPWALRGLLGKAIAGGGLLYLTWRMIAVLWKVKDDAALADATWKAGEFAAFGTTKGVGRVLFTDYLFPFEAVSLVLLIAVVGALVLAHPDHPTATERGAEDKADGAKGPSPPHQGDAEDRLRRGDQAQP